MIYSLKIHILLVNLQPDFFIILLSHFEQFIHGKAYLLLHY